MVESPVFLIIICQRVEPRARLASRTLLGTALNASIEMLLIVGKIITTSTNVWYANYGLTDRLNVLGTVPYVWTTASQGVLHGSQGFQDVALSAKYRVFQASRSGLGPTWTTCCNTRRKSA